jgi:hypothetical protein
MSVRKRSWKTRQGETKEAWVVDYIDSDGDRHIETFDKKCDATSRHAQVAVDVKDGVHVAASKSGTVSEAAEIWFEAARLDGLERSTLRQYRGHIENHIAPVLGRVKLCDLSVAGAQAFSDSLRHKGVSPVMVRKVMASLGSILAEANRRGLVARNVTSELRYKRRKGDARHKAKLKVGVDIPSPAEVSAILAHAGPRWRRWCS